MHVHGATVLLVDDDAIARDALTLFLEHEGYYVIAASSGREAIACLEDPLRRLDIMLLDLVMPDVDGYAVLAHLNQTIQPERDLPVLVMSAHRFDASLLEALGALEELEIERRDFIAKPCDLDELRIRIRRLLRLRASLRLVPPPADELRIYALGSLRVFRRDTLLFDESWRNKPAKNVFKVLLTARGRRFPKEALAEDLWPEADPEIVFNRLRVAIHDLRRQLGEPSPREQHAPTIAQQEGAYVFDAAGRCWTDVEAFEDALRQGRDHAAQGRLQQALDAYQRADALYRGDYLEDDPFGEWGMATRERLREAYLSMLADLARIHGQRDDVDAAVRYCRRILRLEPWREEIYRWLMSYLAEQGRRAEALRVFADCRRALEAEEVDLSPATWQLRSRIDAGITSSRRSIQRHPTSRMAL